MKKWIDSWVMILIGAGLWLLYNYFYYGTLVPVGLNLFLALLFGVCIWGLEKIVYRNKRKE